MKKILSLMLVIIMMLSMVNLSVFAEEIEGNLLSEADSNFESGEISLWKVFYAGEISVVDNPKGEGKVMKYKVDTEAFTEKNNTWQSFSLDLKPLIKEAETIYISMDVYADCAFNFPLTIRAKKEHLDFAAEKDSEYPRLGDIKGDSEWVRKVFTLEITEEDIERKEGTWTLCFDGLPKIKDDIEVYIDNVFIGYDEPDMEDLEEIEEEKATLPEIKPISRQANTLIGAIRWDAFFETDHKTSNVSRQVAKALSPDEFHWHAPFFTNIDENDNVTFPGYSMDIINKEIDYAKEAGLDYFAYLWYETNDPMSDPRKLHLESEKKNDILMCGILEKVRSSATMNELYEAMKDDCYVRIDSRPVVFLYSYEGKNWNQEEITKLREGAVKAGITEPLYLVGMVSKKDAIINNATIKGGADAFSWYAVGPTEKGGEEYVKVADKCRDRINELGAVSGACGYSLIPCVTTGYDTRPRIKNPVSWIDGDPNDADQNKWPYANRYTLDASAEDIGNMLKFTLDYVKENPNNTKANMVLTYAWNEHDEGGWICPTVKCDENGNVLYNDDGTVQIDTQRIDVYKKVIDEYRKIEHTPVEKDPQATDEITATQEPQPNGNGNGNGLVYIIAGGCVLAIAIVAVVVIVLKKKKKD